MKVLYWDAFAGISGDMALGSLIDLGADAELIIEQLHSMGLTEFSLEVKSRQVQSIVATDIDVIIPEQTSGHVDSHDGHRHDSEHGDDYHHIFPCRCLKDIQEMILKGNLTQRAQQNALSVFNLLAEAEAGVHGTTVDEIHFHEVGAVDSLVDIVGTCIALDQLDVEAVKVSELPWSHGFVHCAHGILPLPAPATLILLKGFKFRESGITGELVTPTGAALLRALSEQTSFPTMTIQKIGYGSGKNNYGIPSLLRAVLGEL